MEEAKKGSINFNLLSTHLLEGGTTKRYSSDQKKSLAQLLNDPQFYNFCKNNQRNELEVDFFKAFGYGNSILTRQETLLNWRSLIGRLLNAFALDPLKQEEEEDIEDILPRLPKLENKSSSITVEARSRQIISQSLNVLEEKLENVGPSEETLTLAQLFERYLPNHDYEQFSQHMGYVEHQIETLLQRSSDLFLHKPKLSLQDRTSSLVSGITDSSIPSFHSSFKSDASFQKLSKLPNTPRNSSQEGSFHEIPLNENEAPPPKGVPLHKNEFSLLQSSTQATTQSLPILEEEKENTRRIFCHGCRIL